jgi:hypothetical protein
VIDFVWSPSERVHFETRSTFIEARSSGERVTAVELDHELRWMSSNDARSALSHPSDRWALAQWESRLR